MGTAARTCLAFFIGTPEGVRTSDFYLESDLVLICLFLRLRPLRSSVQIQLVRPYVRYVGFLEIFISRQKRVAHIVLSTGVLKLDFRWSRKVAFTFGALRSDIGVCRVPCFGQLFQYFL